MKLLKNIGFIALMAWSGAAVASQEWQESLQASRQQAMLQFLYKTYDEYPTNFAGYLPADLQAREALQVLEARKVAVDQELAGTSYKNIILSRETFAFIAGELGKTASSSLATFLLKNYGGSRYSDPTNILIRAGRIYLWKGSFALQAISGFGLYKDIQAMRTKRNALNAELTKINAMLAALQNA